MLIVITYQTDPSKLDYFSLFQLPAVFNLDEGALDQRYQQAHKLLQPNCETRALTNQSIEVLAARLNQAYWTLKNPLKRARHLLELNNHWPITHLSGWMEELLTFQEALEANLESTAVDTFLEQEYKMLLKDLECAFVDRHFTEAQKIYLKMVNVARLSEKQQVKIEPA